uniref:Uncharacterized protein n=1 Tax=Meloidogyne enterolobii TaxID=390850 RepID=A0A6V7XBL5_MELEN|nr:unnamed protein product [Meloidogyne enterolobii]
MYGTPKYEKYGKYGLITYYQSYQHMLKTFFIIHIIKTSYANVCVI